MRKTLSHRHSYPPSSRLLSQPDSLIASPPTPAAPAVVDPGTTTPTPSSRFSEIEQVEPSYPRPAEPDQHVPRIEPFVSPLTEANLKYHTNSYPTSREARHFHIESYVESQANVVQLEAELQRRRRAEMRSLVPLDTVSTSDEVIVQQPEPADEAGQQEEKKKKKRRKWYQFRNPFKKPREEGQETTTTTTTTTTATTAHIIPQRNSWAAPDSTSYQHYQTEKLEIMHEGLCGLNNVNIIRALGGDRPTTTSMVLLPSQQQQELKRDSGVSFASQKSRRKRFSVRLGALREDDQEPQQPPSPSTLIGVRYPRMIHRQTLRDAAIHVLSSDLSVWDNDDMDDEYPRNKRFSDPGLVFSP